MKNKIGWIVFIILIYTMIVYLGLPKKDSEAKHIFISDTLYNPNDTLDVDTIYVTKVDSFCATSDCKHTKNEMSPYTKYRHLVHPIW